MADKSSDIMKGTYEIFGATDAQSRIRCGVTWICRRAEHSMQVSISRKDCMMGAITCSRLTCCSSLRSSLHPTTITGAFNCITQIRQKNHNGVSPRDNQSSDQNLHHKAPPPIEKGGITWSRRSSGSQNELSRSSVAGRSQA